MNYKGLLKKITHKDYLGGAFNYYGCCMKKKYHYTDKYLLNPTHPVTVIMIGCGGTGCRILTSLAMMDASLQALGHPGFHVIVYDGDLVEMPNIGRQLFYQCDLSLNKAVVLVSRINRSFGIACPFRNTLIKRLPMEPIFIYPV